jgi:hypothetical protein
LPTYVITAAIQSDLKSGSRKGAQAEVLVGEAGGGGTEWKVSAISLPAILL